MGPLEGEKREKREKRQIDRDSFLRVKSTDISLFLSFNFFLGLAFLKAICRVH